MAAAATDPPLLDEEADSGTTLTCHTCGEVGHISRVCPQRRCNTCGEVGHISKVCPSSQCWHCSQFGHHATACPTAGAPSIEDPDRQCDNETKGQFEDKKECGITPKVAREDANADLDAVAAANNIPTVSLIGDDLDAEVARLVMLVPGELSVVSHLIGKVCVFTQSYTCNTQRFFSTRAYKGFLLKRAGWCWCTTT